MWGGYHTYMDIWTPFVGKLLLVKQEPTSIKDRHAVAVFKDGAIVDHVPYNITPRFSQFLRRDVNIAFTEVAGEKINSGAG